LLPLASRAWDSGDDHPAAKPGDEVPVANIDGELGDNATVPELPAVLLKLKALAVVVVVLVVVLVVEANENGVAGGNGQENAGTGTGFADTPKTPQLLVVAVDAAAVVQVVDAVEAENENGVADVRGDDVTATAGANTGEGAMETDGDCDWPPPN
jgi:hypothetical protein